MLKTMKNNLLIINFLLIILFGSGCSAGQNKTVFAPTITQMKQTEQIIATITPKQSSTNTPTKPAPTKTSIPTPLPTLSETKAEELIYKLVSEDYKCRLPCFAGFSPGVSKIHDAEQFFSIFSQQIYKSPNFHGFLSYLTPPTEFSNSPYVIMSFYSEGDIIDSIFTFRYNYPIKVLLEKYGKPDEVYFFLQYPLSSTAEFDLFFYYREQGFAASYRGEVEYGDTVEICATPPFSGQNGPFLILWSPDEHKTLKELDRISTLSFMSDLNKYVPLEIVLTDSTIDDFYSMFMNSLEKDSCIKLSNPNPQ